MEPTFFETQAAFRAWLTRHHANRDELHIGFYKRASGKPSITYREALDEALCFGWIDGVRRSVDQDAYVQRFTPRRPGSNWSDINIRRVRELIEAGRVAPAGLAAFKARDPDRVDQFARLRDGFSPAFEKRFKARKQAWAFFEKQAPWYQRNASFWVMSAKQETTRERRLQSLIDDSAAGLWVKPLRPAQTRGTASGN